MPFKSKAQMRYLYAKHPSVAKEFAEHTKDFKHLPEHSNMRLEVARKKRKKKQ